MNNLTCDYCGAPILEAERGALHATSVGRETQPLWSTHDYHATQERDCLGAVARLVAAASEANVAGHDVDRCAPQPNPVIRDKEQAARWRELGKVGQDRLVLEVVGEGRLPKSEIVAALQARLGDEYKIYDSYVQNALRHLLAAGEIVREAEDWRGRYRHHYSRTPLSGPIADLERAFHDGGT